MRPPCYHPPATTMCIDHCWHRGNVTFTTNPPQWDETCCHCGQTQRVHEKLPTIPKGHGLPTGLAPASTHEDKNG